MRTSPFCLRLAVARSLLIAAMPGRAQTRAGSHNPGVDRTQADTRSVTIQETLDRARVVELPVNGRNTADPVLPTPGIELAF